MRRADRSRRRFPWWAIIVLAGLILIAYLIIPKPVEVQVAQVREGVLDLALSTTGVVEGLVTDVSTRLTARITRLDFQEGDSVEKGQVLARLESSDVQAEVEGRRAAVRAAEEEAASLQATATADAGQLRAGVSRAKANLQASRENLRQLEAGTRPEDIARQQAVVAQARVQAEDAASRYDRAKELFNRGAISAQDLDTAKAAYESAQAGLRAQQETLRQLQAGPRTEEIEAARAQVAAANSALKQAQSGLGLIQARARDVEAAQARVSSARAALASAEAQLGFTIIRSPVSGVVARKHMEIGETASPLSPIYTVANLSRIWVTAEVDEEDVAAVAVGQTVTITADAYPGREAVGVVTEVSKIAEPKEVGRVRAKIVRARIHIRRSAMPLRPGMEMNITGSLPVGRRTLLVPNDAVIRVGNRDSVYVIREGRARLRNVEIGQANFTETQVISGIRKGDEVAVTNVGQLKDGERVRVVK